MGDPGGRRPYPELVGVTTPVRATRLAVRRRQLRRVPRPPHVGIVMDGNRRWARMAGMAEPGAGHRAGAEHIGDALRWASAWDVSHLTIYVLSADNIAKRASTEIEHLMLLIETVVPEQVLAHPQWCLHTSGDLSLLRASTRDRLEELVDLTRGRPAHLTLAIGYDGRADIVHGIRGALLSAHGAGTGGAGITENAITSSLPGGPVKEIDLVIRTSGEQRLSGFFPWQTSGAHIVLSEKMWPAFTELDFADALLAYAHSVARRS